MTTVYNPLQLIEQSVKCGIKLPPDTNADADWNEFPHWALIQILHMEHAIPISAVAENLRIIAALSDDEASEVSDKELRRRGFNFGDGLS